MLKLISFGEALVDMLSDKSQSTPQQAEVFTKYPGGAPANVAATVAKLGGRSYLAGMLGKDMFGDFLRSSLLQMGVLDNYLLSTDQAKTALAFVSLDDSGERSFSFYRDPGADMLLRPEHLQSDWFKEPGIFHFCSNSMTADRITETTFHAIDTAKQANFCISFDINLRCNLWPSNREYLPLIWRAITQCDILKLSVEEMQALCHSQSQQSVLDQIFAVGVTLVLLTDGGAPLRYYQKTVQSSLTENTLQPPQITMVDSTAAGDAFCGGFLYQLAAKNINRADLATFCSDNLALRQALEFACQCGAHAASKQGAFSSLPSLQELGYS